MMTAPGWNNLETATSIHRFFEVGGIAVLLLLVFFEAFAYVYGNRKEVLQKEHEVAASAKKAHDQASEIDAIKKENERRVADATRSLNERNGETERQITILKDKQAPRRLTVEQKNAILGVAKAFPGQRYSVRYSNSAEADARQLANDFDELLSKTWTSVAPVGAENFVPSSPVGIQVNVSEIYARPNPPRLPPGARPLAETLFKLGIYSGENPNLFVLGNMETGVIWIVIGSRPSGSN